MTTLAPHCLEWFLAGMATPEALGSGFCVLHPQGKKERPRRWHGTGHACRDTPGGAFDKQYGPGNPDLLPSHRSAI